MGEQKGRGEEGREKGKGKGKGKGREKKKEGKREKRRKIIALLTLCIEHASTKK